jgi:translocation and assembly module TamB
MAAAAKVLLLGLASLAAAVLVAVGTGLLVARTNWAQRKLGEVVSKKASLALAGKLTARGVRVSGAFDVCLKEVALQDPDGNTVLTADELCASIEALALPKQEARIRSVSLRRPALTLASLEGPDGKRTTTLARAVAARNPSPPKPGSGPTAWKVSIGSFNLKDGSVRILPALGAEPSFALSGLELAGASAHTSTSGASARLGITGELTAPGDLPVALDLDAQLIGAPATGKAELKELRVRLGRSGLFATGSFDLGANKAALHLRELVLTPGDVDALLPRKPAPGERGGPAGPLLAGELRGSGDAQLEGDHARAALALSAGGGTISIAAEGSVSQRTWSVSAMATRIDPGAVVGRAPHGQVSLQLAANGKGLPRIDAESVRGGVLHGKLHVGPARLEQVGPLVVDLDADLRGRTAFVRAFSASALGLKVQASGAAASDDLALDLRIDAPHLEQVGRAMAAFTRKPGTPISGAASLTARLTGTVKNPDAEVHLRAPAFSVGGGLRASELTVDGTLRGNLLKPDGTLTLASGGIRLGQIDLGAPRIALALEWPVAHVRVDSGVARSDSTPDERAQGRVSVQGDATIDEDRDGLVLSNFTIAYPRNTLRLAHLTRVHLRAAETVVEPLDLTSEGGSLRFSATVRHAVPTRPARVDAAMVVTQFDLGRLPAFALPRGFHLGGEVDANTVIDGPVSAPDMDLSLEVRGLEVQRVRGIDGTVRAHVHGGRVRADGTAGGPAGAQLQFHADAPLENLDQTPANAPFEMSLGLRGLDLKKVAEIAGVRAAVDAKLAGEVEVRAIARGTLSSPRATLSVEARHVTSEKLKPADARIGLLVEKGRATLDGTVELGGASALSMTGSAPFDLVRALREPGYAAGAMGRPLSLELAVAGLPLEQLVHAGVLPPGSTGALQASLHLSGTPRDPVLDFRASGSHLTSGKVRDLSFETGLAADKRIRMSAAVEGGGQPILRAEATVALASHEVVQIARRVSALKAARRQSASPEAGAGAPLIDDATLTSLLDRALSVRVEVPGLLLGRAALVAGEDKAPAEGRLTGNIEVKGTPAVPEIVGRLEVRDLSSEARRLGNADVYVEGNGKGMMVHLGINPPGGGRFLGHAKLVAPLGGRALLEGGMAGLQAGELSATIEAKDLDLVFLSGLLPNLRRTVGKLNADISVAGLLGQPQPQGEAHLRSGVFDVVGQGVFEDVSFDAKLTPKEMVLDKLTGSLGGGTFSAVLVASQKPLGLDGEPQPLEFNGELHLGDDASVAGRKDAQGKPLNAKAVPVRQAGEVRADASGEINFFGDYSGGLLSSTLKIPDARVNVRKLPDKKLPALDPNPDVLLAYPGKKPHPPGKDPEKVEKEAQARLNSNFRVHLDLDLETLFVKAEDFEFKVHSQMRVDYDAQLPDAPTADGTITVPDGSFSALGRRFEIQNAKITETGGDIADPELEIKARFENPQAVVGVSVTGTAKMPQIDLSSSPPMDQDAIAFFLATGRLQGRATQSGGGVDLSGAASSVVGGLLFGQLRQSLADVLPVDVLTIETTQGGVSQASVGKYIGDRVFVGYRQRLIPAPGENTSEGRVEYEISRTLAAEATVGDRNSDVAILFTRDF